MDGVIWGAVLGFLGTACIAIVAFYGHRVTAKVARSQVAVAESTAATDAQRIKLEGWADIVTSLQNEARRKDEALEQKDRIIAARDARIEKLEERLMEYASRRKRTGETK